MRITIAHAIYSFGEGGIENGLVNIINGLDPEKFFHVICCLTTSGKFEQRLQGDHFVVYALNKKPGNDWTLPFKLRKVFRKHQVRIAHLRGWPTLLEGIFAAKLAGVATIIYGFHGKTFEEVGFSSAKRTYAERFALHFVDQIITLSEPMRDDFCGKLRLAPERVTIVHNGVDLAKFKKQVDTSTLSASLGIKAHEFVLGFVGRLDPVKDCATLLRAYAILIEQVPESKLVLVGGGEEETTLKKLTAELGLSKKVIFTGYQKQIYDFLCCMDVYVQASLYEGFSNTIVEAMAVGLPVVATEVGGNASLIREGQNGFLVNAQNPVALSEKMLVLARDPLLRRKISEQNLKVVRNQFSVEMMVKGYEACYLDGRMNR